MNPWAIVFAAGVVGALAFAGMLARDRGPFAALLWLTGCALVAHAGYQAGH